VSEYATVSVRVSELHSGDNSHAVSGRGGGARDVARRGELVPWQEQRWM
jgi:hypothetical protein